MKQAFQKYKPKDVTKHIKALDETNKVVKAIEYTKGKSNYQVIDFENGERTLEHFIKN